MRGASAALMALAGLTGCGRNSAPPAPERLAILRFENLGADVSTDWMGRALSEVVATELTGIRGMRVIGSSQLHGLDGALGVRPASAPGVSAERDLALAAGANRIGYGDYAMRAGHLEARLEIEDPRTGKMVETVAASAPSGDVLGAAASLARQLSSHASGYPTRSQAALREYATALEAQASAGTAAHLEAAISADPDFGPAYRTLAHLEIGGGDRAGALATLQHGLARGSAIGPVERARLEAEAASLGADPGASRRALAALARLQPEDPMVWRSLADAAMNGHAYGEAVESFRKTLALEPEDVAALNQLGYAAVYAGDLKTAMEALRSYRKLRPSDPNALDSMGDVNLIAGHLREAEAFYLEAAGKDANFLGGGDRFKAAMARLMTGDRDGADALEKQFLDARTAGHDPLVPYRQAQWAWVSGRRKEACRQLESFAREGGQGPLREVASRAWAELAIWKRVSCDREGALAAAFQSAATEPAAPGGALTSAGVARFLSQPSASAVSARVERLTPGAQGPLRDRMFAYALLLDGEFDAASEVLKRLYSGAGTPSEEEIAILLAWSYLETGRYQDAAPLLRFNPVPSADGPSPFVSFFFPRLYFLRGEAAAKAGHADEARANFKLFLQLSGPDPLVWGEEKTASAAR
jgi:tetratricopeptide (TPR) repeat protein